MIIAARGECNCIQNDDAGRAERVRQHEIVFARGEHAADQEGDPDDVADGHAHFARDEAVVEGVFDEEDDTKEQREAGNPGEELDPHELLPVKGGRWSGCGACPGRLGYGRWGDGFGDWWRRGLGWGRLLENRFRLRRQRRWLSRR